MSQNEASLGQPQARGSTSAKWAPLAVLLCGPFVYVLDFFVINVALPDIQRGLHASAAAIEWVVAGYALTSACLLVTGGRLGDLYGRRRMFTLGIAAFAVTSALCALAPDTGFLVAARLAQGAAAAIMAPNVLSIIGIAYSGPDRVRAITAYGLVMGLAAAGGQLIGGLLIGANLGGLGWRAIFWVNVPVSLAAVVAARWLVPESCGAGRGRLDLVGVALLTAALVAIVLPLSIGRADGWPAWSLESLAAGPVLLAGFGWWLRAVGRRGGQPLLDPAIFAVRPLRAGLTVQVLFWCQQAAGYLVIALYLQQGRGLSPIASGEVFSVLAAGYLATSLPAPALIVRFGRWVIFTGALAAALGDCLLALAAWDWGTGGPLAAFLPPLAVLGAGQGLCITPLTTTALSHASPKTAGSVSGALSTAQQVGNAIGVALTGIVFYGLAPRGMAASFGWSAAELGALLLGVAALSLIISRAPSGSRQPREG
ncbi:MAG TPA: MFS transporter [Trebonia sp.]|nr:MFS transporter [Trebonia sp.]